MSRETGVQAAREKGKKSESDRRHEDRGREGWGGRQAHRQVDGQEDRHTQRQLNKGVGSFARL